MVREIVLDTETTGLDPSSGHRIVEIACVELVNYVPSGRTFHVYLNPQRVMPDEAFAVHGLSAEFLSDKPLFTDIYGDFLNFVGGARLIIHNAEFDLKFLNAELKRVDAPVFVNGCAFDTLSYARKKHPGASNSLDALCARYKVNNSTRTKHGALLDAELLADVYVELMGGRQTNLVLGIAAAMSPILVANVEKERGTPLQSRVSDAGFAAHKNFIATLGKSAVWCDYLDG